jgi:hypothetical protein
MASRVERSTLALGVRTEIVLVLLSPRLHVDMALGSLHFSGVENASVEVQAEGALIWPASPQPTQGSIIIVAPKLLQITAEHGNLNFSCRDEFRELPEGKPFESIWLRPLDRTTLRLEAGKKQVSGAKSLILSSAPGLRR